jgi:hypothetical protein
MSISPVDYEKGEKGVAVDEKDVSAGATITIAEDTVEAAHECMPMIPISFATWIAIDFLYRYGRPVQENTN